MFRKTHYWASTFLAVLLLSGCGEEITTTQNNPIIQEANASDSQLTVSATGVGPINGDTPFNIHKITQAFPNYSVVEQLNFQEGESYPIISVSKGAKRLMTINPTLDLKSIYAVIVEDNLIENTLKHRLGTLFMGIYTGNTPYNCQPGSEEMAGKVLCMPPTGSNRLYLFTGKWDGPDDKVPPSTVLYKWALEAIVWKP
ncbi:MAG: DUF1131 family protein [Leucothrix sp.]